MTSKQDIIDLEKKFWTATQKRDPDTATTLMADPCVLAGSSGVMALTRKDYARMAEGSSWELHAFKFDKIDVRFPSKDVAVIGYVVDEDMTVEGKKLRLKAADTSTWVKQDGEWLCVSHTESILGDPFGRDRQPMKKAA